MGKDPEEVMMVGVIGSVECMNKFWTKDLCDAIGKSLAREAGANVAIVTGGMYGASATLTFGRPIISIVARCLFQWLEAY